MANGIPTAGVPELVEALRELGIEVLPSVLTLPELLICLRAISSNQNPTEDLDELKR
jgi:hypothetical protein